MKQIAILVFIAIAIAGKIDTLQWVDDPEPCEIQGTHYLKQGMCFYCTMANGVRFGEKVEFPDHKKVGWKTEFDRFSSIGSIYRETDKGEIVDEMLFHCDFEVWQNFIKKYNRRKITKT